jgi:hypothetical protein
VKLNLYEKRGQSATALVGALEDLGHAHWVSGYEDGVLTSLREGTLLEETIIAGPDG